VVFAREGFTAAMQARAQEDGARLVTAADLYPLTVLSA
jgi:hypothetical protein